MKLKTGDQRQKLEDVELRSQLAGRVIHTYIMSAVLGSTPASGHLLIDLK